MLCCYFPVSRLVFFDRYPTMSHVTLYILFGVWWNSAGSTSFRKWEKLQCNHYAGCEQLWWGSDICGPLKYIPFIKILRNTFRFLEKCYKISCTKTKCGPFFLSPRSPKRHLKCNLELLRSQGNIVKEKTQPSLLPTFLEQWREKSMWGFFAFCVLSSLWSEWLLH